jgi:hypothetical protein
MAEKRTVKRRRKRIPLRFGIDSTERLAFTEDITREGFFIHSALVPATMLHKLKGGMGVKILSFQEGEHAYCAICDALYGGKS